jgi:hypothetical protein
MVDLELLQGNTRLPYLKVIHSGFAILDSQATTIEAHTTFCHELLENQAHEHDAHIRLVSYPDIRVSLGRGIYVHGNVPDNPHLGG